MEQPARLHHGHVERLAVVGHDQIGRVEEVGNRGEECPLRRIAGQQKLADLKRAKIEVSAADEECNSTRSAAQSGRLEIDEHGPSESTDRGQRWIQNPQPAISLDLTLANPDLTVASIRLVAAIDHQALAERRADRAAAENFAYAFRRNRRLVAADVRLIGQLANRVRGPDDIAKARSQVHLRHPLRWSATVNPLT